MAIEVVPVQHRFMIGALHIVLTDVFDLNRLIVVPGRDLNDRRTFVDYVTEYAWFYAGYVCSGDDYRFAGYAMVSNITDCRGDFHFALMPGISPFVLRAAWKRLKPALAGSLRDLEAYILVDRRQTIRLAQMMQFKHVETDGDYWHGRIILRPCTDSRATPAGSAGNPGRR